MTAPAPAAWPLAELHVTIGAWAAQMGASPYIDAEGCRWFLGDMEGWFDSPTVRSAPIPRPLSDGDYDGPATLAARMVTLSGHVIAPTRGKLMAAMEQIGTLLTGQDRLARLTVNEVARGVSRTAVVRLNDGTKIQPAGSQAPLRGVWSLSLYSADPARYGTQVRWVSSARFQPGGGRTYDLVPSRVYGANGSSGTLTAQNDGTRSTWPVIRFAGPLTNPSIQILGGPLISVQLTLAAGQELVIDAAARAVLLGEASRRSFLTFDSQWFALPPGATTLLFQADSGAGTCTVQWRDAW